MDNGDGLTEGSRMIAPRRSTDPLFHNVARVLSYLAFAAIAATSLFILAVVLGF